MTLRGKIIAGSSAKPSIDPKEEIRVSADFFKSYLKKHSFPKSYVLGVSSGQGSGLVRCLAQIVVEELRVKTDDDNYKFTAVRLPYGVQADEEDVQCALKFIQSDVSLAVNIKEGVDGQARELEKAGIDVSDFNRGNIKTRQRMITQYAVARANSGAVIGTDHAAENIIDFFAKFGDGGVDVIPLYRLDKRRGKQSLAELGADPAIYEKVPTVNLEESRPGIADEVALGITYNDIDDYLEDKTVSSEAKEKIGNWWRKTEHKRHLLITVFDDSWK